MTLIIEGTTRRLTIYINVLIIQTKSAIGKLETARLHIRNINHKSDVSLMLQGRRNKVYRAFACMRAVL